VAEISFLLILIKFGVDIRGVLASLGIGGLAVALAAQNTLSNFFGLIKMIADKSFSIGDWIQTKDLEGTVVQIGFISTKIRTFDNALITVPNSTLANSSIKNWNKRKIGRRIKLNLTLTYNSKKENLQKAIDDIKAMLQNHPHIITSEKVNYQEINQFYKQEQKLTSIDDKYGIKTTLLVYLDKFNDSSIDILVYTFTKTTSWDKWLEVKEDILFKIWQIIEQNNLEFAFPSSSIYIEKGQKNI
jgi:MscS family membrane protein